MGYETRILIGKSGQPSKEFEEDKKKPFADGSGFPYKRDKKGNPIPTGRTEHYFQVYAMVDLCKLGYQDDALNQIQKQSHDKQGRDKEVYFFFGEDGNTQINEDRYGDRLYPVPLKDVLEAMKASYDKSAPYRRLTWAIALLESMAVDSEEDLEVLFYGY